MFQRLAFVLVACLLSASAASARSRYSNFDDELKSFGQRHHDELQRVTKLTYAGDVDEANAALIRLAERVDTPAAMFVAGNMLYRLDPDSSYVLHMRAYDARPDEPLVILEWAMERHRRGEYAMAVELYERYVEFIRVSAPSRLFENSWVFGMLADCRVRLGQFREAVAAWSNARRASDLLTPIQEIYGGPSALRRRGDLLKRVRAGDASAAEQLIGLDLATDHDWRTAEPSRFALRIDLPEVAKVLGKQSGRYKAVACWAEAVTGGDPTPERVHRVLTDAGLILGGAGTLPESSLVADRLFALVFAYNLEEPDRLMARFGAELTRRFKSPAGDVDAVDALLRIGAPADRVEAARYGWERYGQARFAAMVLWAQTSRLTADNPDLVKATAQFPEDAAIRALNRDFVEWDKLPADAIAEMIVAEFHRPSSRFGDPLIMSLDELESRFRQLSRKLW